MRGILKPLQSAAEFQSLARGLENNYPYQVVTGLSGSQRSYLLAGLAEEVSPLPLLIVTPGEREAGTMVEELMELLPGAAVRQFPVLQLLPYQVLAQSKEVVSQRLQVLEGLSRGERVVVVAPVEALLRRLVPPEVFRSGVISLDVGGRVDLKELLGRLLDLGYERVDLVEARGQYALRGGILDVFPMTAHRPTRLEFFDDEVDSIRRFNASTQRSEEKAANLVIYPARELAVSPDAWEAARRLMAKEYKEQGRKLARSKDAKAVQQLREKFGEVLEGADSCFAGIEQYLPYFYSEVVTLMDYLPAGAPVFVDDPARIKEIADSVQRERAETYAGLLGQGSVLPSQFAACLGWDRIEAALSRRRGIYSSLLPRQPQLARAQNKVHFSGKTMHNFLGNLKMLSEEIHHWRRAGFAVVLLVNSYQRGRQLLSALKDEQVDAFYTGALEGHVRAGNVVITTGSLGGGFELPGCKLVLIAEPDLYGQRKRPRREWKRTDRLAPLWRSKWAITLSMSITASAATLGWLP